MMGHFYDWQSNFTDDPRLPSPLPYPLTEVWIDGEFFDTPIARCKVGKNGFVCHKSFDESDNAINITGDVQIMFVRSELPDGFLDRFDSHEIIDEPTKRRSVETQEKWETNGLPLLESFLVNQKLLEAAKFALAGIEYMGSDWSDVAGDMLSDAIKSAEASDRDVRVVDHHEIEHRN